MRKVKLMTVPLILGVLMAGFSYAPDQGLTCDEKRLEADRSISVLSAMSRDAVAQRRRPVGFKLSSSVERELLIQYLLHGEKFNYGSDLVPLVIALHETGFRNLRGDHHLGNGVGVSCGLTQIRTDFPNRPTCNKLLKDPMVALEWTANHLNKLYRSTHCTNNGRCLSRYAGAGPKARVFENWVTSTAEYVDKHVELELELKECLPIYI